MRDPVIIGPDPTSIKLYDMFEWPVSFDDNYFHHLSQLTQPDYDYHDAYDADEDFTLFRADAVFTNGGEDYTVPVFASKDKTGKWKWFIRFRPHRTGSWRLRVRVLCRHPHPADSSGEKDAERISLKDKKTKYYEHEFGYKSDDFSKHPSAERRFTVNNDAKLAGPLETPDRTKKDNQNYFYRWTEEGGEYKRRPFFLLGAARPWVVPNRDPHWDSVLDREKELFLPMRDAGCNALYHWMAPWETQLVHQSEFEWWPNSPTSGKPILVEKGVPPPRGVSFTPFPSVRGADKHRRYEFGYRRYDQGRALQTDLILSLATRHNTLVPPDDAGHPLFTDTILLFFSVLPHQSLQDPEHHWGEWGWSHGPRRETLDPSKVYGYQQFKIFDPRIGRDRTISIKEFFMMDPSAKDDWKRKLWKHFANFWRYVIGRWTAYPALASWVLIDELEGVGEGPEKKADNWWWDNIDLTRRWHDNLVQLIRGKLTWEPENKKLPYVGDYLKHPITTSAGYYDGTPDRNNPKPPKDPADARQALAMIDKFCEWPGHGTWQGGDERIDYASNHAYQSVPTWAKPGPPPGARFTGWKMPNSGGHELIRADRWLWDSLCMRLRNWGRANANIPRIITEYGCVERDRPNELWNKYGARVPSFTHFANWAALLLGHAGVPFKWNDGDGFGEMIFRDSPNKTWNKSIYPVNNYQEMVNIVNFLKGPDLKGIALDDLKEAVEISIADEADTPDKSSLDKNFNAWALVNTSRTAAIAWLYDRTFSGDYSRGIVAPTLPPAPPLPPFPVTPKRRWLKIEKAKPRQSYRYDWFDTWEGVFITEGHGTAMTDKNGILKIPLPRFPTSTKTTVSVSHGNDIAIRITVNPYHP